MKRLEDILKGIGAFGLKGLTEGQVSILCLDNRKATEGALFFAMRGTKVDGHQFIEAAIEAGARTIVCEVLPEHLKDNVSYVLVADTSKVVGPIAANFYKHPSQKMKVVGVTGTNGKTTIATLLYQLFKRAGKKVGLLSSVDYRVGNESTPALLTTPDAIAIQMWLAKMVEAGCTHCFMEVSSHGVEQGRIEGLHFEGGIFTNLTHEHLDFHLTFDNYLNAKKGFFDRLPKGAFAITNVDDKHGMVMLQNTAARKYTYALKSMADFKLKVLENTIEGMVMQLEGQEIHSHMIGHFNAYNLLAVYAAALQLGVEKMDALTLLSQLVPANGRFEVLRDGTGTVIGIVDFAHTPDALEKTLHAVNSLKQKHQEVITLVGACGDRDRAKRPMLARIACEHSNKVILTTDHSRFEDPYNIMDEMLTGVEADYCSKVLVVADRRDAIYTACMLAGKEDIVLMAGKGHETYVEIKGEKLPFVERDIFREARQAMKNRRN